MDYPESLSGYGGLFEPNLTEHDGRQFIRSVISACKRKDAGSINACALFLGRQHSTTLIHEDHSRDHHSQAKPTTLAEKVAQELVTIANSIENEIGLKFD